MNPIGRITKTHNHIPRRKSIYLQVCFVIKNNAFKFAVRIQKGLK